MQESGLVLVDLHAGIHEPAEPRATGRHHELVIDGARQQQYDPYAAGSRAEQRLSDRLVGHEVGIGKIDRPPCGGNREEVHRVHGEAAASGRAADDLRPYLAATLLARKVPRAAQGAPGGLQPVLDERGLQIGDRVAFDADVGLSPVSLATPIAHPLRAGAGAPREPDVSVDHQNATMIAIVDLADRRHIYGMEGGHLAPGLGQAVSKLGGHAQRSDPIHEHVAADARPTTLAHGLDEGAGGRARLVEVLRVSERCLRRANGLGLSREDLLAVEEQVDAVAPADRRRRVRLEGRGKGGIPDRDLGEDQREGTPCAPNQRGAQRTGNHEQAKPDLERGAPTVWPPSVGSHACRYLDGVRCTRLLNGDLPIPDSPQVSTWRSPSQLSQDPVPPGGPSRRNYYLTGRGPQINI